MPLTSTSQRQLLLDRYGSPAGQRESGISHLWHMEQLATARLGPSHGIQDAPEVDFQDRDYISDEQLRTTGFYLDCQDRRRRSDAKKLYAANIDVLDHLVRATDDGERQRRHMNVFPKGRAETVEMQRLADQHVQRDRDRVRRQREISKENEAFLRRLQAAGPDVPSTARLGAWHRHTHSKRVRDLSQFKKAETFAGASVLESECQVRLPPTTSSREARVAASVSARAPWPAERAPFTEEPPHPMLYGALGDARPPLLAHQPYPPLTVSDVLASAPSALQPLHDATHYGRSLRQAPGATLPGPDRRTAPLSLIAAESGQKVSDGGAGNAAGAASQRTLLREVRPAWQSIAATDIPLYHYAQDLALRPNARPLVCDTEAECGCTALWRQSAQQRHDASEAQRRAEEAALFSGRAQQKEAQRASLKARVQRDSYFTAAAAAAAAAPLSTSKSFPPPAPGPALADRGASPRNVSADRRPSSRGASHPMRNANALEARVAQRQPLSEAPRVVTASSSSSWHTTEAPPTHAPASNEGSSREDDHALSDLLAQWRAVLDANDTRPFAPL